MITDVLRDFIENAIDRTNKNLIDWKPFRYFPQNRFPEIPKYINQNLCNEYYSFLSHDSFFFYHNEGVIGLILFEIYSGKDGTVNIYHKLILQLREYAPVEYFDYDFNKNLSILHSAILNHLNRDIELPSDLNKFLFNWEVDETPNNAEG